MNPARSLAPALFAGSNAIINVWLYFVGPFVGTILAMGLYQAIRGSCDHTKDVLKEPPGEEEKAIPQTKPVTILICYKKVNNL